MANGEDGDGLTLDPYNGGLDRWRGAITQQVRQSAKDGARHEREMEGMRERHHQEIDGLRRRHDKEIGELRRSCEDLRVEITGANARLAEARSDIEEALQVFNNVREHEWEQLRDSLHDAIGEKVTSKRDIFRFVTAPIVVAIIIALVLYALTGSVAVH